MLHIVVELLLLCYTVVDLLLCYNVIDALLLCYTLW